MSRMLFLSVLFGALITIATFPVQRDTGAGIRCISGGPGALDELGMKYYPQNESGLPLGYYVHAQTPVTDCFDSTDQRVQATGVRYLHAAADVLIWSVVSGIGLSLTKKLRSRNV